MTPDSDPLSHEHDNNPQWQPQPLPAAPAAVPAAVPVTAPENTAGVLVLQWLTYAFWGWTVLAMSVLTATVIANFVAKSDTSSFTPYSSAAVLVLLPIAAACDIFYSRHEPAKKTGASSLVMIIHAVLFALFGIGSLIVAVFSLISLFTSSSDSTAAQTALYSAIIIFVLYAVTFLRTLNPKAHIRQLRRAYMLFMIVAVGVIALLGIFGPVASAHRTRNDKLVEDNLSSVESEIDNYTTSKHQLPASLTTLQLTGDTQKLVSTNLVQYTPNTKAATVSQDTTYYYQLCVNYKQASRDYHAYSNNAANLDANGYSDTLDTYDHPAGHICYKLDSVAYADGQSD